MNLPWLKSLEDAWRTRAEQGRVPHALMLLGPSGVGKRAAAAWIVRERLGLSGADAGPSFPVAIPEHADLHWIRPAEDKETVGIEQIRSLVADLSLTSYEGGGKVAVIDPANAMTANAANSLLKTLEEPPGDALLILVADRVGWLPATIFSRCQRINVVLPPEAESLAWLDRFRPSGAWRDALRLAGGAPLAAIAASDLLEQAAGMSSEFIALLEQRGSPIDVAARWSKYEPEFVLDWLCHTVQDCVYKAVCGASGAVPAGLSESVLRRIDRRNLFCYLDNINQLRGQAAGSYNLQLSLESLLIDWAGGLGDCHRSYSPGTMLPITNAR